MRMQLGGLGLTSVQLRASAAAAQARLNPAPAVIPANPPCPSDGVPGQGDIWTVTDADVVALRAGKKLYYLTPAHSGVVSTVGWGARRGMKIYGQIPGVWNQGLVAGRNLPYQTLNAAQLTSIMQKVRIDSNGSFMGDGGLAFIGIVAAAFGGAALLSTSATGAGVALTTGAGSRLTTAADAAATTAGLAPLSESELAATAAANEAAAAATAAGLAPLSASELAATTAANEAAALGTGGGNLLTAAGGKVLAAGESKIQSLVTQKVQGALTNALSPASQLTTAPAVVPPAQPFPIPPTVILAMMGLLFTLLR